MVLETGNYEQEHIAGDTMIHHMPIFPLNTVIFPRMPVALHIFEERYRAMVRDMEEGDHRFCVALIQEGVEIGGGAVPHEVACLVEIIHLEPLPDGRYNLLALGAERVKITHLDRLSKPYMVGSVEEWPEQQGAVEADLIGKASRLFNEYANYLMTLSGEKLDNFTLPEEAATLSYILATALQVGLDDRQRLLETPGAAARIRAEVAMMQSELPLLRALATGPRPPESNFGPFSQN